MTYGTVAPWHDLPVVLRWKVGAKFSPEGSRAGSTRTERVGRVLIVEDDYFVAMEIESTLEEMQCEVVGIAATGEEALALAEKEKPELVLMDVRLGGLLDGIDAAAVIHERFAIRSLFVTAHSDPQTRARAAKANPIGFASKPFTSQQLTAAVRNALTALDPKP